MAGHLTPAHYTQFHTIEQALISATYARVVGADDALRELDAIRRELESRPAPVRHWADECIETEAATAGGRVN